MIFRVLGVASVLACSLLLGCGSSGGGGTGGTGGNSDAVRANCEKICALTTTLKCPSDSSDCVNECQLGVTVETKCRPVVETAVACAAKRSVSDYECDPDTGESQLKTTVCVSEYDAVVACYLTE
jgi:hypothetical protein